MLWSTAVKLSMAVELGQVFGPEEGVGSVHWLSASALLLGDSLNRQLQLHSMAPGGETAELRQTLQLESKDGAAGLCNAIAVQQQAGLVVLANMERKAVYVLHVRLSADGGASFDYLTKYQLGWPILSMAAEHCSDGGSSGVAKLYCVQTHAIQAYALQLAECVPARSSAAVAEVSGRRSGQEGRSAAPASRPDVMPTHAVADSEEEESRPGSAHSAGALSSPDLDASLPRRPPPVTTPPAAAVQQPRLLTPKQLIKLAGSRSASLGSAAGADAAAARDAARDGQPAPSSSQAFGLQRAPTPPAKPPSPALSGDRASSGLAPLFGGTIAGGQPVAVSQAPETPSPSTNGAVPAPMKILKRKKDGEAPPQADSEVSCSLSCSPQSSKALHLSLACLCTSGALHLVSGFCKHRLHHFAYLLHRVVDSLVQTRRVRQARPLPRAV